MSPGARRGVGARVSALGPAPLAFVAAIAAAGPLLVFWGRKRWFIIDDWDFLSARRAFSLHDLFRSHEGHWVTLPIIVYRALWTVFGIRTYLPYELVTIALHVAAALLLRRLMRKSGVTPWVATALATLFLFFGAGADDVLRSFQMTFDGSLVFGLTALLLATHDGPVDRRDALAALAALVAVMCSGVGVAMVAAVAIAVWIRRGLPTALLLAVPIATIYAAWFMLIGHQGVARNFTGLSVQHVMGYVRDGLFAAFTDLGHLRGVGVVYGLALAAGIIALFSQPSRRSAAPALGALAGAVVFLAMTASVRSVPVSGLGLTSAHGVVKAGEGRYVYIAAALTLPAIALGADALIQRWRPLAIVASAALVIGLVGNVSQFVRDPNILFLREYTATAARDPLLKDLPPSLFVAGLALPVRAGWLLDAERAGRAPSSAPLTPQQASDTTLTILLVHRTREQPENCSTLVSPRFVVVPPEHLLAFVGGSGAIAYAPIGAPRSRMFVLSGKALPNPSRVPLRFFIAPVGTASTARVCTGARSGS